MNTLFSARIQGASFDISLGQMFLKTSEQNPEFKKSAQDIGFGGEMVLSTEGVCFGGQRKVTAVGSNL